MKWWVLFLFSFLLSVTYASGWTIEKFKDGIKIYTRKVAESSVEEFRAFATIDAPRETVFKAILEVEKFPNWFPDITEAKEISRTSFNNRIIYYRLDCPWPADDRDVVLESNVSVDDEKGVSIIQVKEKLNIKSKVDGVVRMPKSRGFWKFTSIGDKTQVHYQMLADPGGVMPSWLINMFIVDSPFDALVALRKRVE
ncbi:START domain-containing protein [Paracrocinitomix mangrovi]|uniref:START domain-containing protein n=1 Tax=Paracrocinitomix mangrovi TaxID=2862509 RepID=UPI001C8EB940|nr:START domain-containing protein [Paracrocinitomix mangrovi]UKN01954.1 START domain-containing protein [Paracrocinitomix mangrovi]